MENQHRKISGYRELTQVEIDLMNDIKAEGRRIKEITDRVQAHILAQSDQAVEAAAAQGHETSDEIKRMHEAEPMRWLKIGCTDLQQGLMAVTRAVAQPTTF